MKYRIKLEVFRPTHITFRDKKDTRWCAQVIDRNGASLSVDDDWSLGYDFGDTKEEALLKLRIKLVKHEADKKEINDLNIKMGEVVEIEL